MSFDCVECGKQFSNEDALRQHLTAKHGAAEQAPAKPGFRLPSIKLVLAVVVLLGLAAGIAWLASQPRPERLPGYQDHWHAGFEARVCGERQPDFAYSPGGVHTHGDGKIHVHPHAADELGKYANLRKYFSSIKLEVTGSSLKFPDGRSFNNGDSCADGRAGTVRVVINGKPREDFLEYVVQQGDFIKVDFGP